MSDVVACAQCGRRNRVPASATGKPRCAQCQAWLPWIVNAGDGDYGTVVETAALPVLVDLWAPWCTVPDGVPRTGTIGRRIRRPSEVGEDQRR